MSAKSDLVVVGAGGLGSFVAKELSDSLRTVVIDTKPFSSEGIHISSNGTYKADVLDIRKRLLEKWSTVINMVRSGRELVVVADLGTKVGCAAATPLGRLAAQTHGGFVLLMPSSLERERIFHAGVVYGKLKKWGHRIIIIEKDGVYSGLWNLDLDSLEKAGASRLRLAMDRLVLPFFSEHRDFQGTGLLSIRCGNRASESLVTEAMLELKGKIGRSEAWTEDALVIASNGTPAVELAAALYQSREVWNVPLTYELQEINENLVGVLIIVAGPTIYDQYDPLQRLRSVEVDESYYDAGLVWTAMPTPVMPFEL